MASNMQDASAPSEGTATASQYETLQLQLPLNPLQLQDQVRLFENHLPLASEVLTSRGVRLQDFKVTITYSAPNQDLPRILPPARESILPPLVSRVPRLPPLAVRVPVLPPARVPMAPDLDLTAGADERSDPMIDAPASPSPSPGVEEAESQTPGAPLIVQTTITESNMDDDEDDQEDEGSDNDEDPSDDEYAPPGNAAPTLPNPQCKICMDEFAPEGRVIIDCGCVYCATCLNDHIMHGLSSRANYPARCCSEEGIDIGNTSSYLNFEVILRWSEVEAEYKERRPMYCQNKKCSAHIPESRLGGENKFIGCNSCDTDTCKGCKQWRFDHGGEDVEVCPEDIVSKEDRELADSEKWSKFYIQHCPFSLLTLSQSSALDARILSNARKGVTTCSML